MRPHSLFSLGATIFLAPILFAQTTPSHNASLGELSDSFEALAARVRPAVVQIFSTGYVTGDDSDTTTASSLLSTQRSTGSGIIMTPDGYIMTNNHVVAGARRIEVLLYTANRKARGSRIPAKLIGADRDTDLALIKIDAASLPTLTLADSNALKQGQLVMAFGNPLGLEGSASMGIISSTRRRLKPEDPMVYVQTDAPINPGNSGGPLVDTNGHIVGLNTLILTQSGGSEGLGFAIPSNVVSSVYDQLKKNGHVHRGQIGVTVQTITPEMAQGLHLAQDWGVIAADVTPDGPADKAGLKVGDIILTVNDRTMDDAPELETAIYRLKLSEVVHLTILRDTQKMEYYVPVIERDDDPQRFADMVNPQDNLVRRLGILGIDLNQKITDMLPDLRHDYGVLVAARASSPPYSGPPFNTGDVIYELNRNTITSVKALRGALDQLKPGEPAVLEIERNGTLIYLVAEFE
ncbi:MAG TPA: trypsin-like peptidase domain-containing protein [Bryobacteraceae bacterium]|nr:trypsin-like peptidase domain-containing protein [Bryobacteraceae bacterium]